MTSQKETHLNQPQCFRSYVSFREGRMTWKKHAFSSTSQPCDIWKPSKPWFDEEYRNQKHFCWFVSLQKVPVTSTWTKNWPIGNIRPTFQLGTKTGFIMKLHLYIIYLDMIWQWLIHPEYLWYTADPWDWNVYLHAMVDFFGRLVGNYSIHIYPMGYVMLLFHAAFRKCFVTMLAHIPYSTRRPLVAVKRYCWEGCLN